MKNLQNLGLKDSRMMSDHQGEIRCINDKCSTIKSNQ